ncbi:MAG: DUF5127 domain-containing protein [Verrucomicrobiota bacterium]
MLEKKGDDLRIDWGQFGIVAPTNDGISSGIVQRGDARLNESSFNDTNLLSKAGVEDSPASSIAVVLKFDLGRVSESPSTRWLILYYDDFYSIQYMKKNLRPFWKAHGWTMKEFDWKYRFGLSSLLTFMAALQRSWELLGYNTHRSRIAASSSTPS